VEFIDSLKTLNFSSKYDNTKRELLLSVPSNMNLKKKYPLIVSPHPFGFSNFENFAHGTPDLLYPFSGWSGLSNEYKVIIVLPLGHGRIYEKISLGYEGQIKDIVDVPEILNQYNFKIDESRMYLCGLSMGGMETLTTMGMYPGVYKAGFSFNGIADLSKWFFDILDKKVDKKLLDMKIDELVRDEVGNIQTEPNYYAKRSAISYIENLTKANLMLYWSSKDTVVPNQKLYQSKRLHDLIKQKNSNAQVFEHNHTDDHGYKKFDSEQCIKCHEYSDFKLAAEWLLLNF
jgi:predicted peptidase